VTTIELARAMDAAIKQNLTGLYHLTQNEPIDKYSLLKLFKEIFSRDDIEIQPSDDGAVDKSLVNTRTDFNFSIKSYREQVNDMLTWVKTHENMYRYTITKKEKETLFTW
jgi:dTDP-4-dehydrorhamnose reductase